MPKSQAVESEIPPARPVLADDPPRFLLLQREVEIEYRPQMLAALQCKVDAVVEAKVFKKYSQMKLQMKREALKKVSRKANEGQAGYDKERAN